MVSSSPESTTWTPGHSWSTVWTEHQCVRRPKRFARLLGTWSSRGGPLAGCRRPLVEVGSGLKPVTGQLGPGEGRVLACEPSTLLAGLGCCTSQQWLCPSHCTAHSTTNHKTEGFHSYPLWSKTQGTEHLEVPKSSQMWSFYFKLVVKFFLLDDFMATWS